MIATRSLLLAIAVAWVGCGTDDVVAIDLATGKTQSFDSHDSIPAGWTRCVDPSCSEIPDSIPCQNIGADVCERRTGCVTATVDAPPSPGPSSSNTEGSVPGSGGSAAGAAPPPVCVPTDAPRCDARRSQQRCAQLDRCRWEALCPDAPEGAPQPMCEARCVETRLAPCERLSQTRCDRRQDCGWLPLPCPGLDPDGSATDAPVCQPFCQPLKPTCPAVQSAPNGGVCADGGRSVPVFDGNGCVMGFECTQTCPSPAPGPLCSPGTSSVPIHDAAGCVTGYRCSDTATDCQQLADRYRKTFADARACQDRSATPPACDTLFNNTLMCGCPAYVNSLNTDAISTLRALRLQAQKAGCFEDMACPEIGCALSSEAQCVGPMNAQLCTGTPS